MQFDVKTILDWVELVVAVGIPVALALWGIWKKDQSVDKKIAESVPLVWGAVQQALRKGDGKLPGGKQPLAYALEMLSGFVKMNDKQKQMAEVALRAYHEAQGAPDPGKK